LSTKTQTRAPARALVGAAMFGSALGLVAISAQGLRPGATTASNDQAPAASQAEARSSTTTTEGGAAAPARQPRVIKASILPEIPAPLLTPVPGLSFRKIPATERDVECLTRAVYFESRGDTDVGQAAVAQVVINRARHPAFPKSVCGVVNQGVERGSCQFSFVCKPTKVTDQREWRRARQVAEKALNGHTVEAVGTSTFFHAARVNPGWKLTRVGQFGAHVFYKYPGKKGAPSTFAAAPKPSLLDQIAAPIQAALAKPAVTTATTPPAPILALPAQPAAAVQVAAKAAPGHSASTTGTSPVEASAQLVKAEPIITPTGPLVGAASHVPPSPSPTVQPIAAKPVAPATPPATVS
jgi:spore germination cell wall hydrolase CwlJ-like protein